jgi:PAS domain S-box-containing protein
MNSVQKMAEEEFKKSDERHRTILRAAMDGFWMVDMAGRLLEVNDAYCRMSGYSVSELLAMCVPDLEVLETSELTSAHIAMIEVGGGDRFETRHRRKDGSIIDVEVSAQYRTIEGGRIIAFLRDITESKRAELALQHEQKLYEDLVAALPAGVYRLRVNRRGKWAPETWRTMVDEHYSIDMVSDRFCAILGIPRDAFLANPGIVPDLIHPDDKEDFYAKNAQAMTDFTAFTWDGRIISNEQARWVHFESLPRVIDSETVLWTGIVYDITERKQAEEALREREEQLHVIFDTSQAGIILVDHQGTILFANNRMAEMFGMSLGELIGRSYPEHLHPAERQVGDEKMRQLIRGDIQSVSTERHYIRADGSDFWGILSGKRLQNPDGTLRALVGIIADISESKQAEEEREQFHKFFQLSSDVMCIADPNGAFLRTNPACTETLGYSESELTSKSFIEFIHPDDKQATLDEMAKQLQKGYSLDFENRYVCKDGSVKWLSWRAIYNKDEGITYATARDVTEQKKLQEQLSQAQKLESVGRLAGGVAHDFNNMLSVILGHVELAQKKVDVTAPLCEHLEQIHKAAERSADIVRQLLAFARKQTVTPRVLDLNETMAGMLKMLRRLIGEDIDLVLLPGEMLWPVKLDSAQIDQILANLCVNARDAIAGVGRITIETENVTFDAGFCAGHKGFVPGEYVMLTVIDDGCGMDRDILKKIFEPFFTTKSLGQGTGLGLATVYGIVKQNNGFIDVYSNPGQGTSFKIYLPRYLGTDEQVSAAGPKESAGRGQETVLMVEDEPAILDLGKQMLELQGYRVLAAGTPGEAIRLAEEHMGEIHLLMTDVVMPEMNGRDLASKLLSLYPGLKRLFMSGYTADAIAHHGVLDEGIHFIQKPFSFDALVAKVREALDH